MSSRTDCSGSSTSGSRHTRVTSQTLVDAKLHENIAESKTSFDYSAYVNLSSSSSIGEINVSAYHQHAKREILIQPFGCMIAVDEQNLNVIAYSENAPEMLGLAPHAVPSAGQCDSLTFGSDVRTLFQSSGAASLQKAANSGEVAFLNPILVHSGYSSKPFYAILHRIESGFVIDLEPVLPADVPVTAAGALKSYKLAAKAISRLQSLPSGNISLLCDVLVKEVSDLTGYDRVMVYKFHEDEHGEVVAELCRSDLEPYLGLHYPATDIPQAARFLFMKNKVRMICDCLAPPIKVMQDKRLTHPLSLSGSTLRAPHGCHAQYMNNMGSIASLVLSITINEDDEAVEGDCQTGKKLWGLVVCHHTSPWFVPFPLRYACEFLIQVFSVQVSKEVELAAQLREKHILRTQTMLCDMLLRDAPLGIITKSPNVMDLVKCDGAALYYNNKVWPLGVTPTEAQIKGISDWLLKYHGGTMGLITDCLMEAGYAGASILGDTVCGMAAVSITAKDFLFWFRSHTAKEVRWGGAENNHGDREVGRMIHPRSSFKAYMEVVKHRSIPWEDMEMDAIHSLQLILRGSLQDEVAGDSKSIVNVPGVDSGVRRVDKLRIITSEMVHLIETASVPILAVDSSGIINGWNTKAVELTGLAVQKAVGRPLIDIVEDDSFSALKNMLSLAFQGVEESDVEIKLKTFGPRERNGSIILVGNACCSRDIKGSIVGVCFVGQDVTGQRLIMDKYACAHGDYVGIVRNPCALIPPIFMMDEQGRCVEWNDAMQKLSGLKREDAVNRMLLGEVFAANDFGCRVQDDDTLTRLRIFLNSVIVGESADKLLFAFFGRRGNYVEAFLIANKRSNADGKITGALCFLHVGSPELQYAVQVQRISENAAADRAMKLEYVRREIKKSLSGIVFVHKQLESSSLNVEQEQLLKTSTLCLEQLAEVVDDSDMESIEECYMELRHGEFNIGKVVEASMSQVMTLSKEREVQIIQDLPTDLSSMNLYGDSLRLQQALSTFLSNVILFTPAMKDSSVAFRSLPKKKRIGAAMHLVQLEFRMTHPSPGIPEAVIQEMFDSSREAAMSREGLVLHVGQKLMKMMDGTVQYLREAERSTFIVSVEFPLVEHGGP